MLRNKRQSPVAPSLHDTLYGKLMIIDVAGNPRILTDSEQDTIDSVLGFYGNKSSQWLTDLTRSEDPWLKARKGLGIGERGDHEISHAAMAEYYGSL